MAGAEKKKKKKKIEPIKVNFSASVKRLKGSEVNLKILIAFENRETDVRTGQKEVPWMQKKIKNTKKIKNSCSKPQGFCERAS